MILKHPKTISTDGLYICGDIHGDWPYLNKFINKKQPKTIFACGDYGAWFKFSGTDVLGDRVLKNGRVVKKIWYLDGVKNQHPGTDILFAPGNHEDWEGLNTLTNNEICNRVFYMPRGTIIELDNGKRVLFIGGAASIDYNNRTSGYDYFPQEEVMSTLQFHNMMNSIENEHIDIVISHTCPEEFYFHSNLKNYCRHKMNDPTYIVLSRILNHFKPSRWYFGHFHHYVNGNYNGCEYYGLDMLGWGCYNNWIKFK